MLTLVIGFAQLANVMPSSVQLYFNERNDLERMLRINSTDATASQYRMFAPSRMINGIEMVDAFIDIEDKAVLNTLKANGVIINCEFDGFVTAQVPVNALTKVSKIPGVIDVEVSRIVDLCTDSTLRVTNAWQVLNGPDYGLPQAYDGSGVVIGIIDAGFDYQHLAFRCANDTSRTRIVRVYDPENETGHTVTIGSNTLPGSVFMDEQIDTLTNDGTGTHGTHTASIAAGMHMYGYGGMAPGADIVLCSSRMLNIYTSETEVVNCIKYIYSYADSVGKPCVISVSVSNRYGAHDGNDRISKAVAETVGPGHIFVIAAGNEGSRNYYTGGPATTEKPLNMVIGSQESGLNTDNTYFYRSAWLDTWVRARNTRGLVKFHIFDRYNKRIVWESDYIKTYTRITTHDPEISQYFEYVPSVDTIGYMYGLISLSPTSMKYEIQTFVHNLRNKEYTIDSDGQYHGRYHIGISIYAPQILYPRQPDSIYVDSWSVQGVRLAYNGEVYVDVPSEEGDSVTTQAITGFYTMPSNEACIGPYAVNDSTISTGAYVAKKYFFSLPDQTTVYDNMGYSLGGLYSVSGYQSPGSGPTGAHLPTITAPGYFVVSAVSRFSYFNTNNGGRGHRDLVIRENGNLWGVMSGTSMAAPTVAGIIAQWLQIDPNLSPSDVKNVIAQTAIKDNFTQGNNSVRFGPNGKIDAMAGVQYLLSLQEPVVEVLPGDVDGNGYINVADISWLIRHLLGEGVDINIENADVDQDGSISVKDIATLIQMLLQEE